MAEETKTVDTSTEVTTGETETTAPETTQPVSNAEIEKLKTENAKLKAAVTNATADASSWKKKFRETQTEAERTEAERSERESAMAQELEGYRASARVAKYKASLMDCGYDAETAESMANTLPDGLGDEFFAGQKSFLENQRKSIETSLLNKQPGLSVGKPVTSENTQDAEMAKIRGYWGLK